VGAGHGRSITTHNGLCFPHPHVVYLFPQRDVIAVNDDVLTQVRQMLLVQRWAALASLREDGSPAAAFVAYVTEPGFNGFLLHISRLAEHTRNLLQRPALALAISEPDTGRGDPQLLARITIQGSVAVIPRGTPDYLASRERYLAKLPDAEQLFGFEDFVLMRLHPQEARYVGGFARAFHLTAEQLRQLAVL
jgi:heme iron utilization protein